jgi:hypothetical protein
MDSYAWQAPGQARRPPPREKDPLVAVSVRAHRVRNTILARWSFKLQICPAIP